MGGGTPKRSPSAARSDHVVSGSRIPTRPFVPGPRLQLAGQQHLGVPGRGPGGLHRREDAVDHPAVAVGIAEGGRVITTKSPPAGAAPSRGARAPNSADAKANPYPLWGRHRTPQRDKRPACELVPWRSAQLGYSG